MDKALKQRLVGAIVLIGLAVIVLPMIFGGRPSSEGSGPSEIEFSSPPPDLEFETRRFPVGDQPPPQPSADMQAPEESQDNVTEADTPQPLPQPQTPEESPVVEEAISKTPVEIVPSGVEDPPRAQEQEPEDNVAQPQPAEEVAQTEPVSSGPLRYVVQVASFGSTQNATRLAGQLEDAGYAVLLDHVSSESAQLNRVRVGPYASEASAQAVVRELRDRFEGINPRMVDLQPDQVTPAIANDDPLMRWVVQVGSFSSTENANNLVARLRLAGHSSYDEAVTTATSTIFRVRVGPFLDRDEAIRAEQRIRADLGIDGVVMSFD